MIEVAARPQPGVSQTLQPPTQAVIQAIVVMAIALSLTACTSDRSQAPDWTAAPSATAPAPTEIAARSAAPSRPAATIGASPPAKWECTEYPYPDAEFRFRGRGPLITSALDGKLILAAPFDVEFGTGFGRSVDGRTWPEDETKIRSDIWALGLTRRDTVFIAVGHLPPDPETGARAAAAWLSQDGLTWEAVRDQPAFQTDALIDVVGNDPALVATDGRVIVRGTADGASWARIPVSGDGDGVVEILDLAVADNGFVAVGRNGTGAAAWMSPDGRSWRPASIDDGGRDFWMVAADRSQLIAVGRTSDGTSRRWASTDGGESWAPMPQVSGEGPTGDAAVFATPAGFIAVSTARIGTDPLEIWNLSPNGTWTEASIAGDGDGRGGDLEPWSVASNDAGVVIAARTTDGVAPARIAFCAGDLGNR